MNTLEKVTSCFLFPRLVVGFGFMLTVEYLFNTYLSIGPKIKVCPITPYQTEYFYKATFNISVVISKQQKDVTYLTCLLRLREER